MPIVRMGCGWVDFGAGLDGGFGGGASPGVVCTGGVSLQAFVFAWVS